MAKYFSASTVAFYDTNIVDQNNLPEDSVLLTDEEYTDLMTHQCSGCVIVAGTDGRPVPMQQICEPCTCLEHDETKATAERLGHIKVGKGLNVTEDGTLSVQEGAGGGSSRNVGELVHSLIPLKDAGLHLLDGSQLPVGGVYDEFVSYMGSLYTEQAPEGKWLKGKEISLPTFEANTQDGITISDSRENTTVLQAIFNGKNKSNQIGDWATYWINIDYRVNTLLQSYTIQADNNGSAEYPSAWELKGSNDGESWETIDTQSDIVFSLNELKTFNTNATQPYKQYRIVFSDGILSSSNGELQNISFNVNETVYGYESGIFATEEQWQDSVIAYGSCGKFVYVEGEYLRLPKVSDIIQSTTDISRCGALIEAGLPNITGLMTFSQNQVSGDGVLYTLEGAVSGYVHPSGAGNQNGKWRFDASKYNPIYGNSTTVQPQTIQGLLYIVVATSTKTDIQIDIDNVITDLDNKADRDLSNITKPYVVETWRSGDGFSWYRLWSDGWIEQGGREYFTVKTEKVITFARAFSGTGYGTFFTVEKDTSTATSYTDDTSITTLSQTKTTVTAYMYDGGGNSYNTYVRWYACGY